jgi:hypothetical protein
MQKLPAYTTKKGIFNRIGLYMAKALSENCVLIFPQMGYEPLLGKLVDLLHILNPLPQTLPVATE